MIVESGKDNKWEVKIEGVEELSTLAPGSMKVVVEP